MGTRSWTGARSSERPLGRSFFDRPASALARALLGARFRVWGARRSRTARLVEVEAYLHGDPASHAFRGPTPRNRSMFTRPGTLYVYRIHQVVCANLVARRGEAVLLRAAAIEGADDAREGRGPGRLCRVLGITIADDGASVVARGRFSVFAPKCPIGRVRRGPRIGIRKAAERPLRFWLEGEPSVSGPRRSSASASPSRSRAAGRYRRIRTRSRPSSGGGRRGGRSAGR
jgi:DNA-3-methyladenine glycosylase